MDLDAAKTRLKKARMADARAVVSVHTQTNKQKHAYSIRKTKISKLQTNSVAMMTMVKY